MMNQSLSSTEDIEKHVRYSRHLSIPHNRTSFSNVKSRRILNATIPLPKNPEIIIQFQHLAMSFQQIQLFNYNTKKIIYC
jgi:hypothetical protein